MNHTSLHSPKCKHVSVTFLSRRWYLSGNRENLSAQAQGHVTSCLIYPKKADADCRQVQSNQPFVGVKLNCSAKHLRPHGLTILTGKMHFQLLSFQQFYEFELRFCLWKIPYP